jgi:hypothetical protein
MRLTNAPLLLGKIFGVTWAIFMLLVVVSYTAKLAVWLAFQVSRRGCASIRRVLVGAFLKEAPPKSFSFFGCFVSPAPLDVDCSSFGRLLDVFWTISSPSPSPSPSPSSPQPLNLTPDSFENLLSPDYDVHACVLDGSAYANYLSQNPKYATINQVSRMRLTNASNDPPGVKDREGE